MASRIYTQMFEEHPFIMLAIINGILSVTGDSCAQILGGVSMSWDGYRTLRYLIFGAGIAPLAAMWNLIRQFDFEPFGDTKHHRRTSSGVQSDAVGPTVQPPPPNPAAALEGINLYLLAKRLAVDQIFMAPISFVIFFVAMGLMEGLGPAAIYYKTTNNLIPILWSNWKVWPLIQTVTFLYIPLKYRVPSGGVCGVLWTIYLSIFNAASSAKAAP
ncbi:hypothetical protein RQP46_010199 [Phenoliferia psychrophenolica]